MDLHALEGREQLICEGTSHLLKAGVRWVGPQVRASLPRVRTSQVPSS